MDAVSKPRKRVTAQATKDALIATGIDLLGEEGFSIGLEHVTLERALRRADLPRSSAYHVWDAEPGDAPPQAKFQRAVLRRILTQSFEGRQFDDTVKAAAGVLASLPPGTPPATALREVIRVAALATVMMTASEDEWRVRMAAQHGSVLAGTEEFDVKDWITQAEAEWRQRVVDEIYRPVAAAVGLRPRPEFGEQAWELMAIAAAALADGIAFRVRYLDGLGLEEIELPRADGEGTEPWTLFALALEAIVHRLAELDPDATPSIGAADDMRSGLE